MKRLSIIFTLTLVLSLMTNPVIGQDSDGDGIPDNEDNCPYNKNGPYLGTCVDGLISVPPYMDCIPILLCEENDYGHCSLGQEDTDGDGLGDPCDNCLSKPNGPDLGTCISGNIGDPCTIPGGNESECGTGGFCSKHQEDEDDDGLGDACDFCPFDIDSDDDGICDDDDNCISKPNGPCRGICTKGSKSKNGICTIPGFNEYECGSIGFCSMEQEDTYPPSGNECGDACDCEGDFDANGNVDGRDAYRFMQDFFKCQTNCDGDFICDGDVDGSDAFMFKRDYFSPSCATNCNPRGSAGWCGD